MGRLRVLFGQLIALSIVVFVTANAQFGVIAPQMIEGAGNQKYDMSRMSEPDCAPLFDRLEKLIADGSETNCLVAPGEWSGLDFFMMGPSLFILLSGRIKIARVGTKKDRFYKTAFSAGVVLFAIAVLDRMGVLPTQVNSTGLAALIPISVAPWVVQILLALVGSLLMMGPKYWEAEAITQAGESIGKRREAAHHFRQKYGSVSTPLHARAGSNQRINRSRLLQRDSRLHMRRGAGKGIKVYATCPFCNGGGCEKCDFKGTL